MKLMKELIQEWDIKEILNEGADLNIPVKMAKKSLTKLVSEIEKHDGGSFNAGSDEYHITEGSPDLYGDRYRNLIKWEQSVHEMVNKIIKEYKKAWNND
tara:strand:+ start:951 stop:1247 length:297 start_codon:yes stop_codon:yes gene_type:complete